MVDISTYKDTCACTHEHIIHKHMSIDYMQMHIPSQSRVADPITINIRKMISGGSHIKYCTILLKTGNTNQITYQLIIK